MRQYGSIILALLAMGLVLDGAKAADAPTTQNGVAMVSESDSGVGLSFERPQSWLAEGSKIINPKSGETEVAFAEDNRRLCTLKISGVSEPGVTYKIDTTTPADPSATVSKILQIDGHPARMTAHRIPDSDSELLIVQMANGPRSCTASFIFPRSQRDRHLKIIDAVCASIKYLKS